MREMKFRAWDKQYKKMYYKGFAIRAVGQNHTSGGVLFDVSVFGKHQYNPLEMEYMQFTGLKDKNGKEIYEGDIITPLIGLSPGPRPDKGVVKFREGEFVDSYWGDSVRTHFLDGAGPEVIGNIYSNPELLEKK